MMNYKWEEAIAERNPVPPELIDEINAEDAAEWCMALNMRDTEDRITTQLVSKYLKTGEVLKKFVHHYPQWKRDATLLSQYDFKRELIMRFPDYMGALELCGVHEDDIPFTPHELPPHLFEVYEKVDMRTRLSVASELLKDPESTPKAKMESLNNPGNEFYLLPHKETVKDLRQLQKKQRLEKDHTPSWLSDETLQFVESQQKMLGRPVPIDEPPSAPIAPLEHS